jgi:hypothetical protein
MRLLPFQLPDCRVIGASPPRLAVSIAKAMFCSRFSMRCPSNAPCLVVGIDVSATAPAPLTYLPLVSGLMEGPPHNHSPALPAVGIQPRAWDRRGAFCALIYAECATICGSPTTRPDSATWHASLTCPTRPDSLAVSPAPPSFSRAPVLGRTTRSREPFAMPTSRGVAAIARSASIDHHTTVIVGLPDWGRCP